MVKAVIKISILLIIFSMPYNRQEIIANISDKMNKDNEKAQVATIGGGCFWCVEAIYENLEGVESVVSGYSGGSVKNPGYRDISSGLTGHAEVCQITFDPDVISFEEIIEIFWEVHDPTTLNRQGADIGPQYRSVIFYHSENQKKIAMDSMKKMDESRFFSSPIVTEIVSFSEFYKAEDLHQNYFLNNLNQPYCSVVISPKVKKFKKKHKDQLK